MPTFLNTMVTGTTVLLVAGSLWMAVWAWQRFRVSVFLWWLASRVSAFVALLLAGVPDQERLNAKVGTFAKEQHLDLDPVEMYVSMLTLTNLIPILTTTCLAVIAIGELSHVGPRIAPGYEPGRVLRCVHRLRIIWGVLAVLFSVALHLASRAY
ncbi:MAG: hypothetical protein R3F13_19145 [Prosthecobacter sp.]